MKKEIIICIISIMLVCACVPTPTEEFVVNRSDNVAQQIIEASPVPEISEQGHFVPISFPEEWNDMIETPHLSIPIKAEVITSGQSIYPVRTVQKKRFTASDVAPIANILLSDRKAYHLGAQYTRSDYEDAIRSALDHGLEDAASELNDMLEDVKLTEEDFQLMPDDFFSNTFVGGGDVAKEDADKLAESFKKNLGNDRLSVEVKSMKDEDVAAIITLSEENRRMQDMMKMYGMGDTGMYGGAETLVLNANHPLVKYVLAHGDEEIVPTIEKQLYDLAVLSHKPLTQEEMTEFVKRSNEIMMMLTK
jgi:hypothetical protein